MQVVTHVPATSAQRGGCYICKCDQRHDPRTNALEPMIDCDTELEITVRPDDLEAIFRSVTEGKSLVICQSCWIEGAALLGCPTPAQSEQREAEIDELNGRLTDALEMLAAAQEANQALLKSAHTAAFGAPAQAKPKADAK